MSSQPSPPRAIAFSDLTFVPRAQDGNMAELAEICGEADGTPLGTGFCRLTKAAIKWTVRYDEVLIVLEGQVRVHTAAGVLTAGPKDSIWLPAGTALTYEAEDALVVYAIHPVDWQKRQAA